MNKQVKRAGGSLKVMGAVGTGDNVRRKIRVTVNIVIVIDDLQRGIAA